MEIVHALVACGCSALLCSGPELCAEPGLIPQLAIV
jgi:hypothetical protein